MVANKQIETVQTEDGSLSCRDQETGELYHNRAGAFTEALKNYVRPSGAVCVLQKTGQLSVLDVCFGLGYNTWVLLSYLDLCRVTGARVKVVALESDPQVLPLCEQALGYPPLERVRCALAKPVDFAVSRHILSSGLEIELDIRNVDLRQHLRAVPGDFDLVFHDPFSPKRCPELWTVELFTEYRRLLATRTGKVLTYSSASAVRGGLIEAGFAVWRTEAVGGKSGGTLAATPGCQAPAEYVFPVAGAELLRLRSRSAVPYRDPGLTSNRAEIWQRRESELRRWPGPGASAES